MKAFKRSLPFTVLDEARNTGGVAGVLERAARARERKLTATSKRSVRVCAAMERSECGQFSFSRTLPCRPTD